MTGSMPSFLNKPRSWAKKTGNMLNAGDGTAMRGFSSDAVCAQTLATNAIRKSATDNESDLGVELTNIDGRPMPALV